MRPVEKNALLVRPRSNTPLEALALLNDPTFITAAKAFAARVMRENSTDVHTRQLEALRINAAMRIAIGRDADSQEHAALLALYRHELERFGNDTKACSEFLDSQEAVSITWPSDSTDAQRAAWSSVGRAVLNLHETLYRP